LQSAHLFSNTMVVSGNKYGAFPQHSSSSLIVLLSRTCNSFFSYCCWGRDACSTVREMRSLDTNNMERLMKWSSVVLFCPILLVLMTLRADGRVCLIAFDFPLIAGFEMDLHVLSCLLQCSSSSKLEMTMLWNATSSCLSLLIRKTECINYSLIVIFGYELS
jgi:hypothetical protein